MSRPSPLTVAEAAVPFQGALDRLVLEPAPRLLRAWPLLGAGLLAGLVALAALLPVDVVVVGTGRIATDAPAIQLRPMTRAVLSELRVRPGEPVRKGQVLARLDPTMPDADRAALLAEAATVASEIRRREAELQGFAAPEPGSTALLDLRSAEAQAQAAAQSRSLTGLQHALALEQAALPAIQEQLAIARAVEERRRILFERKSAAEVDLLAARAERLRVEAALSASRLRMAETENRIAAVQDDMATELATRRRAAAEALVALRLRRDQIDAALAKAGRIAALSVLIAPRDAVVASVAPGGIGAVMAEGEPVLVLVPVDAPLLAEVTLSSADIGQVGIGDPVVLKLDAFPWRRLGTAEGVIESLAPLSVAPPDGGPARHPLRVRLTKVPPGLSSAAAILPGMTVSAEIGTGTRSVMDFFLDPLARGLSESLREP